MIPCALAYAILNFSYLMALSQGTAANAIALATLAAPHEAVIVHEHSHIATDEAGAPGFFGSGVTLMGRQGASGRMVAEDVAPLLNQPDNPHWPSPAAISLTNATEYGTVYSAEAMAGTARVVTRASTERPSFFMERDFTQSTSGVARKMHSNVQVSMRPSALASLARAKS